MFIPFSQYGTFDKDLFHFNILPLQNASNYLESITNKNSQLYLEYSRLFSNIDTILDEANKGLIIIENGSV